MILLPPSILALIYAFTTVNAAISLEDFSSDTFSLSSELENIVPPCAQSCFISFLEDNFPASICSTSPTLDCLCTHNSTTGYTVGEGAVQCIVSEDNIGFCQGEDATSAIAQDAYNMCTWLLDALPNTHATLTATLVIATGTPSIVTIAPSTTTPTTLSTRKSSSATSTSAAKTSSSATGTIDAATSSPLVPQTTMSSMTSSAVPSSTALLGSQQPSVATEVASPLSKAQISGIAVGSVGALALVIGAILLCLRRRRRIMAQRDRDSNPFPFQMEPEKPVNSGLVGFVGPNEQWNGNGGKPMPIVPPRLLTDPNMFARSSRIEQGPSGSGTIGLAISPDTKQNRSSKLLPEKPTMKLHVPPASNLPLKPPPRFPLLPSIMPKAQEAYQSRDSDMTQFDEDPNTPYRYTGDSDVFVDTGSQERILRPDQKEEWSQSPGSLAVPRPLNIRKSQQPPPRQNFSQPYPTPGAASSVYSFHQSYAPTEADRETSLYAGWRPQKAPLNPYNPYVPWQPPQDWQIDIAPAPAPAPARERPQRPLRPEQSKSYSKPMPRQRSESMDSATSMESQAAEYIPRTPDTRHLEQNLSPVAESPRTGKSPVTYPEIPGRGLPSTIRMVEPPPPQPVFTPTPAQGRRRSQIEIARQQQQFQQQQKQQQARNSGLNQPWRAAEIEQARARSQAAAAASRQGISQTQGIPNYPNGPHRGSRAIGQTMTTQPGQQSRLRVNTENNRPILAQINTNPNPRGSIPPRLPLKVNPPSNGTGLTQPPTIRQIVPSGQSKAFQAIYPEPRRASGLSQASGSETSSLAARRARTPVPLQLFGQGNPGSQWKKPGDPVTPVTAGPDGPLSPGMHLTPRAIGDDLFLMVG